MGVSIVDSKSSSRFIIHYQCQRWQGGPRGAWEQCDQKKSPNVYKSCQKNISVEKFDTYTKIT